MEDVWRVCENSVVTRALGARVLGTRVLGIRLLRSLAIVLLMMVCSQALAGTFTAYGPTSFQRGTGTPVVETVSFSIQDPSAPYQLQLTNGGIQDDTTVGELVSSSEIKTNGSVVIAQVVNLQ